MIDSLQIARNILAAGAGDFLVQIDWALSRELHGPQVGGEHGPPGAEEHDCVERPTLEKVEQQKQEGDIQLERNEELLHPDAQPARPAKIEGVIVASDAAEVEINHMLKTSTGIIVYLILNNDPYNWS